MLDNARKLRREGFAILPIPYKQKRPALDGWQKLRLTEEDLATHFNGRPQNIGVLLGDPSGGVVDIDVDALEALPIVGLFLPSTRSFGRASKPKSHHLFVARGIETKQFKDTQGSMLVEIRSTGA